LQQSGAENQGATQGFAGRPGDTTEQTASDPTIQLQQHADHRPTSDSTDMNGYGREGGTFG